MRNLSLSHILAILLLTACIYKLFINQTKITQGITPPAPGTITKVSQGTLAQVKTKGTGAVSLTKQRPRPNANNGEPTEELPPSRANARNQKSLEQVKDFQSRAHLEFTPPPGFEFVEIDNDDEFLILAGKNHDDHHLTMIAGRVQATDQQVKPFLNENIGLFKGRLKTENVNALKIVKKVTNYNNSGDVTIMHTELSGKTVYVGLMKRNDRKGAYLFVLDGDSKLSDSEDYYERILSNIKTK